MSLIGGIFRIRWHSISERSDYLINLLLAAFEIRPDGSKTVRPLTIELHTMAQFSVVKFSATLSVGGINLINSTHLLYFPCL